MVNEEKYTLVGVDGNAYCIMGYVVSALKREKRPLSEIDHYLSDAMSDDYTYLINVSISVLNKLNNKCYHNVDYNTADKFPNLAPKPAPLSCATLYCPAVYEVEK